MDFRFRLKSGDEAGNKFAKTSCGINCGGISCSEDLPSLGLLGTHPRCNAASSFES